MKKFIKKFADFVSGCVSVRTALVSLVYSAITFVSLLVSFLLRFDFNFASIGRYNILDLYLLVLPLKICCLAVQGVAELLSYARRGAHILVDADCLNRAVFPELAGV